MVYSVDAQLYILEGDNLHPQKAGKVFFKKGLSYGKFMIDNKVYMIFALNHSITARRVWLKKIDYARVICKSLRKPITIPVSAKGRIEFISMPEKDVENIFSK